jgi:transposase InsO family protein
MSSNSKRLTEIGIDQSMPRPGDCWNNACLENFLDISCWYNEYNGMRPHSRIYGMSPIAFTLIMTDQGEYGLQYNESSSFSHT